MIRLIVAAALYGASVGMLYGLPQVLRNVVKLPLLLLGTGAVCAMVYHLVARWFAPLKLAQVGEMVGRLYHDAAVLLASLASVNVFLALVLEPPAGVHALNDYPLFLGLNIIFVGACGSLALVHQARALLQHVRPLRALSIMTAWLSVSLVIGGQWAFYLRPIFGIAAIETADMPFCAGNAPDFRGATNFFEVVLHLLVPPDLAIREG